MVNSLESVSSSSMYCSCGSNQSTGGHLHDGGTAVVMKVNNKPVCTSNAEYRKGETGTWDALSNMGVCTDIVPVKKGDTIGLTAQYNLELHPARKHAGGGEAEEMGLELFSFAASTDSNVNVSTDLMKSLNS